MKNIFYIGYCPICRQGLLEIVKEKTTDKLFIYCDECEAEWETPANAVNNVNGSRNKYGEIVEATETEIATKKWQDYVIKP